MTVRRFESRYHPGDDAWAVVYSRALVRPLAACMLPVMIVTLVAVLEEIDVMPHALWAAGGAFVLASIWTSFTLRRRIAEIRVSGPWVHVRSVADVVSNRADSARRVLDVRDYGSWSDAAIGLTSYELERRAWPAYEDLVEALEASMDAT